MVLRDTRYVANVLGTHLKTAQRLCASGELRAIRIGRRWRIRDEWIEEYLELRKNAKND